MRYTTLTTLILGIFLSFPLAAAAPSWQVGFMEGKAVAISPSKKVTLKIIKPKGGIWGHFIIPITPEQTGILKKHQINPHYSFVPAYITIDDIERRSTAKVNRYKHYVSIDVDQRQWEGLKKGKTLMIELPDGTQYPEPLRGSRKAIKKVEKDFYLNQTKTE